MLRTFFLPIVSILFFYSPSQAQYYIKILGYSIDTVYPKLKNASSREKMHLYNQLAFYHSLSDSDSALYYANMAHELAEKYEDRHQEGAALRNMGNAYALDGKYLEAMTHLQQALNIFEGIDEPNKVAEMYVDLGKLNYDLEDYNKSLVYAEKYMELADVEFSKGNPVATPVEKAIITGLVAIAAREAVNYILAEKYFKEYLEISKNYSIPASLHTAYVKSLGETFELADMLDSALKYTCMARSQLPKNKDKPFEKHTGYEESIGHILLRQGNMQDAFPLIRKAYYNEIGGGYFYYGAYSAFNLGDIYLDFEQYDSALYWYETGLALAGKVLSRLNEDETTSASQIVYSGYQTVFNISQVEVRQLYYSLMLHTHYEFYHFYKLTGGYSKALEHHEKQYRYKDSLNRAITNLEERKTQVRFESERMEQQLQLMEQETELAQSNVRQTRIFLFGIIGFLVAILFMVLLYLRQNRLKAEQDKIVLQQQLFRSQMNPHFLYNSLASIQNFIVTEDPENASIYLSKFSSLVRSILDSSNEEFVPLDKEIKLIGNYLALQKVRFTEKFNYSIEVDEELDTENLQIPPMLAQPFIENAIEHGIKHKKGKGLVMVRFRRLSDCTIFEVEDDGVGREKARDLLLKREESHTSLATIISRKRIAAMNKKHHLKISMEIIDLKDDQGQARGTLVRFVIPD